MITIYGIKTCSTVRKAIKFCKDNGLEYTFVDFRVTPLEAEKINSFVSKVPVNLLFNTRGTQYRELKLKELNLDDAAKIEWLIKENMLLKRPVVEYTKAGKDKALVAFDEAIYTKEFLENKEIV